MPSTLVRQARHTLSALETGKEAASAQVDLFAAPAATPEAEPSEVDRALAGINPDMLSPKEALEALYRLKNLQQQEATS